jgi:predicted PurR-regulated permease PerM
MQDRVVRYSVLFIALVLAAIVLQTLQEVLRPLAIALLLLFVFTPLARFSRERGVPAWLTMGGLISDN